VNTPPATDLTEVAPPPAAFPWPPAESQSGLDALVDSWRGAVLRPASFFAALPPQLRLGAALLYYLIVGIVAAAIQLFWATLLPRPESSLISELVGTGVGVTPLLEFLFSPLYLLFSLYLAAAVTHLLVLALVPGQRGFGVTLRVFAFAYSPVLFGVVPFIGPIAAFLWMTVISIVGIRETHYTSTARAAGAVLLPVAGALLFLVTGLVLMGGAEALLSR